MKVLYVAAESAPYAQVGGLSQAVSLLARAIAKLGHDARIFMPKYGTIDMKKYPASLHSSKLAVPTGHPAGGKLPHLLLCNVLHRDSGHNAVPTYFLENREYFELRANVYGYGDEHVRFYLLSLGCLEWLLQQQSKRAWVPDIIHAHDWHTGYLVDALKRHPRYKKPLKRMRILYTVHNFKHQGNFDFKYAKSHSTESATLLPALDPKMRLQNPLLRGIMSADWVNTVSNTYAEEVTTKEFGEGLHRYLKHYNYKFSGIANGIDTVIMNPATDKLLAARYTARNLSNRLKNKAFAQKAFKLPRRSDLPLVAFIGRLAAQKGIENILQLLEHINSLPTAQFIFLGGGDDGFCSALQHLCLQYPEQISAILYSDFTLSRKIFGGSDIVLMPSRFEPGGIVAMEALRYGSVPIVADTGGLSETVTQFNPKTGVGNGFFHKRNDLWSLHTALVTALAHYQIPRVWQQLVKNAMSCDFSWDHAALEYERLYKKLI